MSRNTRTQGDWGALVLAELDGHEAPGSTARLIAEATGKVAADADDVAASTLLKLAQALGTSGGVQAQIKSLASASEKARAEQAALVKLRQDTETDLAKAHADHQARIERELADHRKTLAAGQAELESVKTQAANLLARAKSDSEITARLRDKAARKLAAFESVA
jgi:hypothetical protein